MKHKQRDLHSVLKKLEICMSFQTYTVLIKMS